MPADHTFCCIASLEFQTWMGNPELVKLNLGESFQRFLENGTFPLQDFCIGASGHDARSIANSARDA